MFNHTRATITATVRDIRRFVCIITVLSQLITAGYFTYLSCTGTGTLPVNIILASVSLAYLVIYLATYGAKEKRIKQVKGIALRTARAIKLLGKTLMLAITVYGIYVSSATTDAITIILATLSIISWIIQTLFEIVRSYVEIKANEFMESLRQDTEFIRHPIQTAAEKARQFAPELAELASEGAEVVKHGVRALGAGKGIVSRLRGLPFSLKRKGKDNPQIPLIEISDDELIKK